MPPTHKANQQGVSDLAYISWCTPDVLNTRGGKGGDGAVLAAVVGVNTEAAW